MKFKAVSTRPHLPVALLSLMQIMHVVPNHERVTRLQTCLCSREQHVLCTSGQMKMMMAVAYRGRKSGCVSLPFIFQAGEGYIDARD